MKRLTEIAVHSVGTLVAALVPKAAEEQDNPYKIILNPSDVTLNWQKLSAVAGKAILPAGYAVYSAYIRRGLEVNLKKPPYETLFTNEYNLHLMVAPKTWCTEKHIREIGEIGLLLNRSIKKPRPDLFLSADIAPSSPCHGIEVRYISDEMLKAGETHWQQHGEPGLTALTHERPGPMQDIASGITTWALDSRTISECLPALLHNRVTTHRTQFPAGLVR